MGTAHQILARPLSGRFQKTVRPTLGAFGLETGRGPFSTASRREEIRRALLELVKVELKVVVEELKQLHREVKRKRGRLKRGNGEMLPSEGGRP